MALNCSPMKTCAVKLLAKVTCNISVLKNLFKYSDSNTLKIYLQNIIGYYCYEIHLKHNAHENKEIRYGSENI